MERFGFKFNLSYPLTLLGSTVFLILGSFAMVSFYDYVRLSVRIEATIDRWKVIKKSSSSYPIQGSYQFEFQGKSWQGASILPPPHNLNRLAAKKIIERLPVGTRSVWIDPRNPKFSSLEKRFPLKPVLYSLTAFGVTLYFWFVETNSRIRNPIH